MSSDFVPLRDDAEEGRPGPPRSFEVDDVDDAADGDDAAACLGGRCKKGSRTCVWGSVGGAFVVLCLIGLVVFLTAGDGRRCMQQPLVKHAQQVLETNWRGHNTIPSPTLYPHQWSWDSAFISIGYSWYDLQRARTELTSLFAAQWSNGLLPHIVFNPAVPPGSYWPGPPFWNCSALNSAAPAVPATSGIVQPPIHATAVAAIMSRASESNDDGSSMAWLVEIYPRLVRWMDYLYDERDPDNDGLVYIRHPWESGMDNSPNWDAALRNIHLKPGDVPPYHRADTHRPGVNPADRPSNWTYDRFVYLVECAKKHGYDESAIIKACPFTVDDVLFNSALARADLDMASLARSLGHRSDEDRFTRRYQKTSEGIKSKMWNAEDGLFYDYDEIQGTQVREAVAGSFLPVWAGVVDESSDRAKPLLRHLESASFCGDGACNAVPTYDTKAVNFSTHNYWRGPSWININWLIQRGLTRWLPSSGADIAGAIQESTQHLVSKTGFYEYFNPYDGSGHGTDGFSWTAALYIDTICTDDPSWSD